MNEWINKQQKISGERINKEPQKFEGKDKITKI